MISQLNIPYVDECFCLYSLKKASANSPCSSRVALSVRYFADLVVALSAVDPVNPTVAPPDRPSVRLLCPVCNQL